VLTKLDYTVVAFGVVIVFAMVGYFLEGKKRYKGPRLPAMIETNKSVVSNEQRTMIVPDASSSA
jgi:hypothetical protein